MPPRNDWFIRLARPDGIRWPSNVWIHAAAQSEIDDILDDFQNTEIAEEFVAKLNQRLKFLSENLGRETIHSQWFESLKNASLSSMKFKGSGLKNLRILYILHNRQAFLLSAFSERSTADYQKGINLAKSRMKDI